MKKEIELKNRLSTLSISYANVQKNMVAFVFCVFCAFIILFFAGTLPLMSGLWAFGGLILGLSVIFFVPVMNDGGSKVNYAELGSFGTRFQAGKNSVGRAKK